MIRCAILLVLCLLTMSGRLNAQTVVSGNVSDVQGKPLENVIVKLIGGSRIYLYGFTDSKGNYVMELSDSVKIEKPSLVFSHIGYKTVERVIESGALSRFVRISLEQSVQNLAEIKIKATPLRLKGDTLSYLLSSFLGKGDVTLEDGLKRLPGIEVSNSGGISYMGKSISHFYIEGLDMLGGRYNLATRNIPAEYTSSVEILRNHKDKKIDRDEESESVALNIKLKNKARFRPFGQSQVGAGWREDDALYAIGLTGMMFMDNFQTICSGKYSNYGDFASYEMIDHFGGSGARSLVMSRLGGFDGGRPPKGEFLNQTNGMVSLNMIKKMDSLSTVRTNANYSYEDRSYSHSAMSAYFVDGGNVSLNESMSPHTRLHKPSLEINLRSDAARKYMNNILKFTAQIEQNENPVVKVMNGGREDISQKRNASGFELTNRLIARMFIGKHKMGINSYCQFVRTPELTMTFGMPSPDGGAERQNIVQTGQSTSFRTIESTTFTLKLSEKVRINLPATLNASYDFIETNRMSAASVLSGNRVRGWRISPSASPSFEWKSPNKRLWMNLSSQVRWLSMSYNSVIDDKSTQLHDVYFEPSLRAKYTFSGTSELSFSSSVSNAAGDILDLLTGAVQTDYRSTSASSGVFAKTKSWNTSLSYKYEVPFRFFNLTASASWSQSKRNVLNSQYVDDGNVSSSSVFGDSHSKNAQFNFGLSKNIIALYTKLMFNGSYSWSSSEMMGQERRITTFGNGYGLNAGLTVAPVSFMEVNYGVDFNKFFTRYSGRHNSNESFSHKGRLSFFPVERMELALSYDNIRQQIDADKFKNFSLFDAYAQLKVKRSTLKLSLQNILNTKHYAWTVFDGINTFSYDYRLCGRTLMLTLTYRK